MRLLDAALLGNLLHGQMQSGTGAGRAVADLARVGLGVGEEVVECRPERVRFHHNAKGLAGQADDVAEVAERIERTLASE